MVSKSEQRRSARISGSKDKITQEEITKNDTTEAATSSNTTTSRPAKLKIVNSEDDTELEKGMALTRRTKMLSLPGGWQ